MAISLGELIAAAHQSSQQPSVTDRIQNGHNQASGALGSILGYIYGGKIIGGNSQSGNSPQDLMLKK